MFGKLTVLRLAYVHKTDGAYWACKCSCNNQERDKPYRGSSLIQGKSTSCGCYRLQQVHLKLRHAVGSSIMRQKYIAYKNAAKDRNISFCLDFSIFTHLTSGACDYCGRIGVNESRSKWDVVRYNGIDRVDNSIGYEPSNCVPCCGPCNKAKLKMSRSEFLQLISLIYNNKNKLK